MDTIDKLEQITERLQTIGWNNFSIINEDGCYKLNACYENTMWCLFVYFIDDSTYTVEIEMNETSLVNEVYHMTRDVRNALSTDQFKMFAVDKHCIVAYGRGEWF